MLTPHHLALLASFCPRISRVAFVARRSFLAAEPAAKEDTTATSNKALFGGDFAGYLTTFDSQGSFVPVPEYFVPRDMLEWGQVPERLEVLVRESDAARETTTILPAVGCAVDNLETQQSSSSFAQVFVGDGVVASVDERGVAETIFAWLPEHRLRLQISDGTWKIFHEHRVESLDGMGGGGLDGQRVSRWIGDDLRQSKLSTEGGTLEDGRVLLPESLHVATTKNDQGALSDIVVSREEDGATSGVRFSFDEDGGCEIAALA